jgi:hypothetical protein
MRKNWETWQVDKKGKKEKEEGTDSEVIDVYEAEINVIQGSLLNVHK